MTTHPLTIDLHTHILPPTWPDLRARFGYGGWVSLHRCGTGCTRMMQDGRVFREIHANCWDPDVRRAECDAAHVDVQVLSTVPVMFAYWARPRDTLDVARLLNDHIAEVCAASPDRFIGLGTVPMQDPDLAARELERCVRDLGFPGIQIGSHVNHWNLDAPELFPLFERAEALGAAIFVHPWDMMGQERMPRFWLPWLVGMPAETSLAACSLIFGGVLERLPALRVGLAHGGGAFPSSFGRIEHGFRVRPDLCAVRNPHPPSRYVRRFWYDSLVHDGEALRYLIGFAGADRVALGSDYPFPLGEAVPGALIRSLPGLDDAARARLLGESALAFLGLDRATLPGMSASTPGRRERPPLGRAAH